MCCYADSSSPSKKKKHKKHKHRHHPRPELEDSFASLEDEDEDLNVTGDIEEDVDIVTTTQQPAIRLKIKLGGQTTNVEARYVQWVPTSTFGLLGNNMTPDFSRIYYYTYQKYILVRCVDLYSFFL